MTRKLVMLQKLPKQLKPIIIAASLSLVSLQLPASSLDQCLANIKVIADDQYAISTNNTVVRQLKPTFFGFNLEWLQFELAFWDRSTAKVKPAIIQALKPFNGAIYRYPGGISANHFSWRDAAGDMSKRPTRKLEDWLPPFAISFGPKEYLSFVQAVNGNAWYVANLYGNKEGLQKSQTMVADAGDLARELQALQTTGLPAIYRWELGNELDRSEYKWLPSQLTSSAHNTINAIKQHQPNAQFTIALQEYPAMDAAGLSTKQYNSAVAGSMKSTLNEFAIHLYYDDKWRGITTEKQITSACNALDTAESQGIKSPSVWISEHAFIPKGAWEKPDWKYLWPETGSLQAALSVADMLIAAAMVPQINGAMIHSLHGTDGPWPLFHKAKDDTFHPSVVMHGITMLRTSMLPEVLNTVSTSAHIGDYNGNYDMRAVIMADKSRSQYSVWAVNRSPKPANVTLHIAGLANKKMSVKQVSLSDKQLKADNSLVSMRVVPLQQNQSLNFNAIGNTVITLKPYSVSTLRVSASALIN